MVACAKNVRELVEKIECKINTANYSKYEAALTATTALFDKIMVSFTMMP